MTRAVDRAEAASSRRKRPLRLLGSHSTADGRPRSWWCYALRHKLWRQNFVRPYCSALKMRVVAPSLWHAALNLCPLQGVYVPIDT